MSSYFLRTLFVQTPGTRLVLDVDAVRALRDDAPPRRLPLTAIDAIVVLGGVDVSTPLLIRCAEDGRGVVFLSRFGKPRAYVEGPASGRGALRAAQFRRQFDAVSRDDMARTVVRGKIGQMRWAVRQWGRDADSKRAAELLEVASALEQGERGLDGLTREESLGVEGAASRRYFAALGLALHEWGFPGRRRRPPTDPVNATMSFLYGMTRVAVQGAAHAAGLDPFCGYLHGDRDGQPSLVLDLMEELRPTADRVAVRLFNRRQLREEHFESDLVGAISLNEEGRAVVLDAWHQHRYQEAHLRSAVEAVPNAAVPLVQAYALANALRSGGHYEPHERVVR